MIRVIMPTYHIELNLAGHIVQMKRDEEGRPYVEIEESQRGDLIAAASHMGMYVQFQDESGSSTADAKLACPGVCGDSWNSDELCSDCGMCFYCCRHDPFNGKDRPKTEDGGAPEMDTHSLNTAMAKDLIAGIEDASRLKRIRAGEESHRAFPTGRSGVLKAIDERLKTLQESNG